MSNMPKCRERVALWDNVKFVMILFVVIGHFVDCYHDAPTFQSIFAFIYAFHMPLFILISGFFHRDGGIAKKVGFYLVCGFLMKVLIHAVNLITCQDVHFFVFATNDISWYMFAMAFFVLLTYGIRGFNKKIILLTVFLLSCFAPYDNTIGDVLTWGRIVSFYPFYLLGNLLNPNFFLRVKRHGWSCPLGASILLLWGGYCYFFVQKAYAFRPVFTGHTPYSQLTFQGGAHTRMLLSLLACILCIGWILVIPQGKIPLVSTWGQRTIQVYFWHYPIMKIMNTLHFVEICQYGVAGKAVYIGGAVLLACLLSTSLFGFPTSYVRAYLIPQKKKRGD